MIAKRTMLLSLGLFICIACESAGAGFVQDPFRNDASGFPGFFLTRLASWATENVDLGPLSADEERYIEIFAKEANCFGEHSSAGFIRTFDLALTGIKGIPGKAQGELRLLDLGNHKNLTDLARTIIRKRVRRFDEKLLINRAIGLGFSSRDEGFKILIKDQPSSLLIISVSKNGPTKSERLEIGSKTGDARPGAVRASLQSDRSVDGSGHATTVWHVDQFEALALLPEARAIYELMWATFNINPGAMTWVSPKDYALIYP